MIAVTIYTGGNPQFYELFDHMCLAEDYAAMWRRLAVKSGTLIRVDIDDTYLGVMPDHYGTDDWEDGDV